MIHSHLSQLQKIKALDNQLILREQYASNRWTTLNSIV